MMPIAFLSAAAELPLSYSQPSTDLYENCSGLMKFFILSSAGSMFSLCASASVARSIACTASVTRNEQRYATPPGGLCVYAASTSQNACFKSYEPVQIENSPAGNFDGFAEALA